MTLLQELSPTPQTWYMLGILALWAIIQFLFVGDKAYFRDMLISKEKKAERDEDNKDAQISKLSAKVDELTKKLDDAMITINAQTLEIQRLTLQSQKNNQILDAIKKWMEESKQPTHFLELLKNVS